jgi:hypothetical protein
MPALPLRLLSLLMAVLFSACDPGKPVPGKTSSPLTHSAYVWQRVWTDSVRAAVTDHGSAFAELGVLGTQLEWKSGNPVPAVVRPDVNWKALAATHRRVSAVIRIERPGADDEIVKAVLAEASRLRQAAAADGLTLSVVQIDYDCPQKKLASYAAWLSRISESLKPLPVRITTLASWLGEKDFLTLLRACDQYVLQVHSFERPAPGRRASVCDPDKTRAWVKQASALGHSFTVALPTYRATAGYDASGKLLGVATDSVTPRWVAGTTLEEFPSNPDELSALIAEWNRDRPAGLTGIWWYRLPVETDTRNWRWPALAAVMAGRAPVSKLEVQLNGAQPVDLVLWNRGEKDEWMPAKITVRWPAPAHAVGDGAAGWEFAAGENEGVFTAPAALQKRLLPPDQSTALGWLRFQESAPPVASLRTEISPQARDR